MRLPLCKVQTRVKYIYSIYARSVCAACAVLHMHMVVDMAILLLTTKGTVITLGFFIVAHVCIIVVGRCRFVRFQFAYA